MSIRKNGGIWFARIWRIRVQFSIVKRRTVNISQGSIHERFLTAR